MRIRIATARQAGVITELQLKAALAEQQQWAQARRHPGPDGILTRRCWAGHFPSRPASPAPISQAIRRSAPCGGAADTAESLDWCRSAQGPGAHAAGAMSDPLNISSTDHLVSLTGGRKSRPGSPEPAPSATPSPAGYLGEEVLRDDGEQSMKICHTPPIRSKVLARGWLESVAHAKRPRLPREASPSPRPARAERVEVLRGWRRPSEVRCGP